MIPKLSGPLVKDIRTGEGILEYALGGLAIATTAAGDLSVSKGGTFLAILAISKGVRRGLLKIVALQKGIGIGAPITPAVLSTYATPVTRAVTTMTTDVLGEIAAAQSMTEAKQSEPGAPAEKLPAGLAPTHPDPAPPAAT